MAEKNFISTKIWSDNKFASMTTDEKLAWLYLITNQNVTSIGIYQLDRTFMQYTLKLSESELNDILNKFIDMDLIALENDEILLYNSLYTNGVDGWVYQKIIAKELKQVHNRVLVEKLYNHIKDDTYRLTSTVVDCLPYFKDPSLINQMSDDLKRAYQERKNSNGRKVTVEPEWMKREENNNSQELSAEETSRILAKKKEALKNGK